MKTLDRALMAWRNILGSDYVLTDETTLSEVQTATFLTTQHVPAIIRPAHLGEVQECVRIANTYKIPIYPVSTGKNWGYGSRVPVQDGCVVMELSRLNRIVDYDEKLAYVTVEPGVTMRQLDEFLKEKKSALKMSVTGSTFHSSVVGNVLERGLGSGPYGDRFGHVCGLEVVLPTGECIHTGFGRFHNAQAARVNRWGVGPYIDGLFTQSNLGIVTRMTLWLMPTLTHHQTCLFTINDNDRLEDLIDTLCRLRLQGIISAPVHLYNDYKVLSSIIQYPWQGKDEYVALSPDMMTSIRKALGIGLWNGVVGLHAVNEKLGLVVREVIQQILIEEVDELHFLGNEQTETDADESKDIVNFFKTNVSLNGLSRDGSIQSTYWRKKTPIPLAMDPDRDHCGVIWCAPCLPFDGKHVRTAVNIAEQTFAAHQFEPNMSIICATERNIILNAVLLYDRDVVEEDKRALLCYNELLQKMIKEGYIPYRLGIQSMNALPTPKDDYGKFLCTLKSALDPNNILAPGRYDFQKDWPDSCGSLLHQVPG